MLRHLLIAALLLPLASAHATAPWQGDFTYTCAGVQPGSGPSASLFCGQSRSFSTSNSTGTFHATFDRTSGAADTVEVCIALYVGAPTGTPAASSCAVTNVGASVAVVATGAESTLVVSIGPPPGASGPATVAGPSTWHYKIGHFH